MARGIFVTGTDTGVGKTLACVALLRALSTAGIRAVGMKPVSAGIAPGAPANEDVRALDAASTVSAPLEDRNPIAFADPVAPHLAARRTGHVIDLRLITAAFGRLSGQADAIVVEGAGGALVPLDDRHDMLDIARSLRLPVLLVVGVRLGCLNHARLSALAIRTRALPLAGWVAVRLEDDMPLAEDNIGWLRGELAAPLVGETRRGERLAIGRAALVQLGLAD